jgi:hypothetical protein
MYIFPDNYASLLLRVGHRYFVVEIRYIKLFSLPEIL